MTSSPFHRALLIYSRLTPTHLSGSPIKKYESMHAKTGCIGVQTPFSVPGSQPIPATASDSRGGLLNLGVCLCGVWLIQQIYSAYS